MTDVEAGGIALLLLALGVLALHVEGYVVSETVLLVILAVLLVALVLSAVYVATKNEDTLTLDE